MDPTSVTGRMNPGRIIEMYKNGSSRNAREIIVHDYHTNGLESAFALLVDYLSHFNNEQYFIYKKALEQNDLDGMKAELTMIENRELYYYYKVRSRRKNMQIIRSLEKSNWRLPRRKVIIAGKMSKKPITVAPLYIFLIAKSPRSYLSCASPYLNHYGLPVRPNAEVKIDRPWPNTPVKSKGETELRVMTTNIVDQEPVAELIERCTNMDTHRDIMFELLVTKHPTNIDRIIPRDPKIGFKGSDAVSTFRDTTSTMGFDYGYVEEKS